MFDELLALYREVDALFQGATCDVSTECCRFGVTGREPQVTSIELALVKAAIKKRGGPLSAKRKALPLASSRSQQDERTCPLLDASGRCVIYEHRPLGCRTFFCARANLSTPPSRKEQKEIVRRLQEIAARHENGGEKPRALTRAL